MWLAIALMAGFSGLSLTRGASALPETQRKLTVVIAAIVLGGGMSNNRYLQERGRAAILEVLFNDRLDTPILQNELGDSAGVYGAAWLWGEE